MAMTWEEEVLLLRAENAVLRERIGALEQQIAVLEERGRRPPSFVKPNRSRSAQAQKPRRKREARHNKGRKREKPTKMALHELEHCPDCGSRLYRRKVAWRRQVIELPSLPAAEVTEHVVVKRWCGKCEHWRSPHLDWRGMVVGQGRLGVRLVSVIAYLRTTLRLPLRQIQEYLGTMHGVRVSVGELVEVLHRVRKEGQGLLLGLKEEMRHSAQLHMDETGWREDGRNGYVWVCSTGGAEPVRYYEYDRSRSQAVAQRLLGAQFGGVLSTDFYAGYNRYLGRHQRCWVHLLRDLHELKEEHTQQAEVLEWAEKVRQLYEDAEHFVKTMPAPGQTEREQQYLNSLQRLQPLGLAYASQKKHPCQALAKRLLRHQDELFQFVLIDGLPADNNLAERSLRPLVVSRKISGGTRSSEGSKTRMGLASLFHTWQARGLNPFRQCLALLAQSP
jgi:transposase